MFGTVRRAILCTMSMWKGTEIQFGKNNLCLVMCRMAVTNPSYAKIPIFRISEMQKWMAQLKRVRKAGQENGMVCYISMKTSGDMKDRTFIKSEKCDSAK